MGAEIKKSGRNARGLRTAGVVAFSLALAQLASALPTPVSAAAAAASVDPRILNPVNDSTVTGPDVEIFGDLTGTGDDGGVAVAYVVDVSGSTLSSAGDCNADGVIDALDDVNFDGRRGTILDCEIIGVTALNTALAPRGDVEVGLVAFGSQAASADVLSNDEDDDSTDTADEIFDYFTGPLVDGADANRLADIVDVAVSLTSGRLGAFQVRNVGGGTSFNAAVTEALNLLDESAAARKYVFLLSDGQSSLSTSVVTAAQGSGVQFNTFAVGTGTGSAPCGTAPLGRLATATDGRCVVVTDPTALAADIATGAEGLTVEVTARAGATVIGPLPATIDPLGRWNITMTLSRAIWTVSATVRDAEGTLINVSSVRFTVTGPGYQYTALGDSYSAGEGIDPWRDDDDDWDGPTDPPYDSACHRSRHAYPMLLEAPDSDEPLSLAEESRDLTRFVACSSAVLSNVFEIEQNGRGGVQVPIQFDAVNSGTDLVTMTIGGNDAQFSDIVTHCASNYDCQNDTFQRIGGIELTLRQYVSIRLALLAPQLQQAYASIAERAPNALVIAAGYPHLLGIEPGCLENAVLPLGEREFLYEAVDRYDLLMARAAELAGVNFVSVVDAFEPGVPCTDYAGQRYLNGIDIAWDGFKWKFWTSVKADDQAFHPTTDGQAVYAEVIQAEIDRVGPAGFATGSARVASTRTAPMQAAGGQTLIPDWALEIIGDIPDLNDDQLRELLATQLDGLDVSSVRAAADLDDPCGAFAVRGQRLLWNGDGFAADSQVTVTVGVAGPSQTQFFASADGDGHVAGEAVVPGDAELISTISVHGVDADGVMRLLNGRFAIAEDDTPCLTLAAEAGELDPGTALYRMREVTKDEYKGKFDSEDNGDEKYVVMLERNVAAAAELLGFDDTEGDADGDGWALLGKYKLSKSEFARFWIEDGLPHGAERDPGHGCVTFAPRARDLDEPARKNPKSMKEVGRNTSDCRAEVPSADVDNDGVADDAQTLYRARPGDPARDEKSKEVYVERNVVGAEAVLGVSDHDADGDGWSTVARDKGSLLGFTVVDGAPGGIPVVAIGGSNGCEELTPKSLGVATKSGPDKLESVDDPVGVCP